MLVTAGFESRVYTSYIQAKGNNGGAMGCIKPHVNFLFLLFLLFGSVGAWATETEVKFRDGATLTITTVGNSYSIDLKSSEGKLLKSEKEVQTIKLSSLDYVRRKLGAAAAPEPIVKDDILICAGSSCKILDSTGRETKLLVNPEEITTWAGQGFEYNGQYYYVISIEFLGEKRGTFLVDAANGLAYFLEEKFYAHKAQIDLNITDGGLVSWNGKDGTPSLLKFFSMTNLEALPSSGFNPLNAELLAEVTKQAGEEASQESIQNHKAEKKIDPAAIRGQLKFIKNYLESHVVEQDELIQGSLRLEARRLYYGAINTKPTIIALMGLRGTGKDTFAAAYVDAIYGKEGAHKDHLKKFNAVKTARELWDFQGSPTGYVGSESFPPFMKWLVKHSGGKYRLVSKKNNQQQDVSFIEKNPDWHEGEVLEGYDDPEKSFVYLNEFHDWSKEAKDLFLKTALEYGQFHLNSANGGEEDIYLPLRFIIATNEGTNLLSPKKPNGQPASQRQITYEQLVQKWDAVHNQKELLRDEMLRTNGLPTDPSSDPKGSSQELIDRIPPDAVFLMHPLSPQGLQKLAAMKLTTLSKRRPGGYTLTWSDSLLKEIQELEYEAEQNGRPIEGKVINVVEDTLLRALIDGKLNATEQRAPLNLDVKRNPDKTFDLVVKDQSGKTIELTVPASLAAKIPLIKTDQELEEQFGLQGRLKHHVVGNDKVLQKMSEAIAVTHEGRDPKNKTKNAESARVFMLLGLSSTGKTETLKAIAREYYGDEEALLVLDFSQVRTVHDLQQKVLGFRDGGHVVASDFMTHYDAHNGNIVIAFDEIANAPLDVLKALYDILREPRVSTFADGKIRAMTGVLIGMTGNAGEEWYKDIPRDIPIIEQQLAFEEVYSQATGDPDYRRFTYEKFFSEAFLNRVGEENIFSFGPLTFKSIRELGQLKLGQALERIKTSDGRRSWKVSFASKEDYLKTLEAIEDEGYVLREQGASIDRFVKQQIERQLRYVLLKNKIPDGADVILKRIDDSPQSLDQGRPVAGKVNYQIFVEGQASPIAFQIDKRITPKYPKQSQEDVTLVAFHEAGHELTRHILFGDKYASDLISIIPGVARFGDKWIRYLGVAQYVSSQYVPMTREAAIREMAVLVAGHMAQVLVTQGGIHDAGKQNDMERATAIAQNAILRFGLGEEFGIRSAPERVDLNQYVQSLSEEKRAIYEKEIQNMIVEAQNLARSVLLTNMRQGLIPLGLSLAEKGRLDQPTLDKFYKEHDKEIDLTSFQTLRQSPVKQTQIAAEWSKGEKTDGGFEAHLLTSIPKPKSVANVTALVSEMKAVQINEISIPSTVPIKQLPSNWNRVGACSNLLGDLHH